ncbi:cytochrome c/c1 heme-lyase [Gloeopeniophorella convolvens]|nr:cytochrome c/c1 heme-lyase [Gloeopeniophorella convolvens]
MSDPKCPVDHTALPPPPAPRDACPIDHSVPADACPVDHSTRAAWAQAALPHSSDTLAAPTPTPYPTPATLSTAREVSSIPRTATGERWVYPSEAQFFAAMARKQHAPRAHDMRVVVPIHNAVNERAWAHIQEWEAERGARCGGVRLVSFKGRPAEPTPKARVLTLLGYTPPFDRHDWVVDRCGTRIRYVIDFYAGRALPGTNGSAAFYLDVRPALDSWEAVRMRAGMFVDRWARSVRGAFSGSGSSSIPPSSAKPES